MFLAAEILSQLSEENMEGKREGEASEEKVEWEVRGRRMEARERRVEGEASVCSESMEDVCPPDIWQ